MNSSIAITPAMTSDCHLLSVLFKTVYINTYGLEGVTEEFSNFIEQQFAPSKIRADIESKDSQLWIAKYKDNPVGVLQVALANACPITKVLHPEINKLYLLSRFFGQGIGQQLMKSAESELLQNGYQSAWLWVLASNERAIGFYQKQGYKNIGTADFQMEVNTYKNIVMQKQF